MNPNLRTILFTIGLVTILVTGILILPRVFGLYYQIKGGHLLQTALNAIEGISDIGLTCDPLPADRKGTRAKVEQALTTLLKSLDYYNQNAQANFYLGQAYCLLGDPISAEKYYLVYRRLKPTNPQGYIGVGFVYEARNDQQAAVRAWKAAGLTPQDFINAGDKAYQEKRYENALRWYERSTLLDPSQAKSWLGLGQVFDALSEPEKALEAYQQAWKYDLEISTTTLVNALKKRGDRKAIEEVLRYALEKAPTSTDRLLWMLELGDAMRFQKNWDEAVSIYQQAIKEFPNESVLHISLGWSYYKRGDGIQPAQQEFLRAIELNNESGDGYYALAQLYSQEKQSQRADGYYLQALERAPNNPWYYLARGDNARLAGDLSQALKMYEATITRFPDFTKAYYELALVYRLNHQPKEAIDSIEHALELMDPPVENYYARAGEIYRWAGFPDKAIKAYRQALILNPDNPIAQKGLQLMGEK